MLNKFKIKERSKINLILFRIYKLKIKEVNKL